MHRYGVRRKDAYGWGECIYSEPNRKIVQRSIKLLNNYLKVKLE